MSWLTENGNTVTLTIRVIPRASRSEIIGGYGDALKIKLASPPVDGAANEELVKLLAKSFGVSRIDVEIIAGLTSKTKQVRITGASRERITAILQAKSWHVIFTVSTTQVSAARVSGWAPKD
jgi:uncharacterized protein